MNKTKNVSKRLLNDFGENTERTQRYFRVCNRNVKTAIRKNATALTVVGRHRPNIIILEI